MAKKTNKNAVLLAFQFALRSGWRERKSVRLWADSGAPKNAKPGSWRDVTGALDEGRQGSPLGVGLLRASGWWGGCQVSVRGRPMTCRGVLAWHGPLSPAQGRGPLLLQGLVTSLASWFSRLPHGPGNPETQTRGVVFGRRWADASNAIAQVPRHRRQAPSQVHDQIQASIPPVGNGISRVLRSAMLHAGARTGGALAARRLDRSWPLSRTVCGRFPP